MNATQRWALPATGLALCSAAVVAWIHFGLHSPLWSAGWGVVAGAGVVVAAGTLWGSLRQSKATCEVAGFLETLAQLDAKTVGAEQIEASLPPLRGASPLIAAAQQIAARMLDLSRHVEEIENSQTMENVRARRAAAEAAQMRAILAGFSDPIIAVSAYEEILLANPAACALLQLPETQPAGPLAESLHCAALVELLRGALRRKIASERSEDIEISDAQGARRWYRATVARLNVGDEESQATVGGLAVLRDISERKALQRRNAEFVSAVSHEMKTPLAGIKAYVELLADGDAEDEATREEFLGVINGQADRLQRLIDNLLNLSRIEAGVVQVQRQPRSLNDILEEAARVVLPSAEAKQIELRTELSPLYLGVLADRDMLLQAAINLLSNAVKYTPAGGRVTLRSRMEDRAIRFEVEDTGVGLNEEDSQRVFEKFYRVKKDKDMAPGTGLGLPLAKHIVEDVHNGRIGLSSAPGLGSTFSVTLPSAAAMAPCAV